MNESGCFPVTDRGRKRIGIYFSPYPTRLDPPCNWTNPDGAYAAAWRRLSEMVATLGYPEYVKGTPPKSWGRLYVGEVLHQLAILAALRSRGIAYDWVAGLSLGELVALCAADACDDEDAVRMLIANTRAIVAAGPGDLVMLPYDKEIAKPVADLDVEQVYAFRGSALYACREQALQVLLREHKSAKPLGIDAVPHSSWVAARLIESGFQTIHRRDLQLPCYLATQGERLLRLPTLDDWMRLVRGPVRIDSWLQSLQLERADAIITVGAVGIAEPFARASSGLAAPIVSGESILTGDAVAP